MQLREPRYVTRLQGRLHLPDRELFGPVDDVSLHGAFVHTQLSLPRHCVVDLHVSMPNGDELGFATQVAHCLSTTQAQASGRRSGIGLRLLGSHERNVALWYGHLRALTEQSRTAKRSGRVLLVGNQLPLLKRLVNVLDQVVDAVVPADPASLCRLLGPQTPWHLAIVDGALDETAVGQIAAIMPTLVIVPGAEPARTLRARELGAACVLERPFGNAQLLREVQQLMAASK